MPTNRKPVMKCADCGHARSHHYDPIVRGVSERDMLCRGRSPVDQCKCSKTQLEIERNFNDLLSCMKEALTEYGEFIRRGRK